MTFMPCREEVPNSTVLVPMMPIIRIDVPNSTECVKRGNIPETTSCTRSARDPARRKKVAQILIGSPASPLDVQAEVKDDREAFPFLGIS